MLLAAMMAVPLWALTSITAGDMEITSRLMTFQGNVYVARGGMKAIQKDSVLTSDRGIYDRTLEIVKAIDNVTVIQPGSVLTSNYLEAYVKQDRIVAQGNPKLIRIVDREVRGENGEMVKRKARMILTCNEVEGFNKENRYVAKGDVHVIELPYREGETPEEAKENEKSPTSDLKCEVLEMYSNEDKAIARNNVIIVTKTLRATGEKAIYLDRESRLIIVGHAHGFQTGKEAPGAEEQVSEIFANKIIYYTNEDRTIAVGEVHATVYPKGQKSPYEDKDKKEKKKKKKSVEGGETATETADVSSEPGSEPDLNTSSGNIPTEVTGPLPAGSGAPDNLPPGNYMPIGGEQGAIEATPE